MNLQDRFDRRYKVAKALSETPVGDGTFLDYLMQNVEQHMMGTEEEVLDILLALSKNAIEAAEQPLEYKVPMPKSSTVDPLVETIDLNSVMVQLSKHVNTIGIKREDVLLDKVKGDFTVGNKGAYGNYTDLYTIICFISNDMMVVRKDSSGHLYTEIMNPVYSNSKQYLYKPVPF